MNSSNKRCFVTFSGAGKLIQLIQKKNNHKLVFQVAEKAEDSQNEGASCLTEMMVSNQYLSLLKNRGVEIKPGDQLLFSGEVHPFQRKVVFNGQASIKLSHALQVTRLSFLPQFMHNSNDKN